MGKAVDTNISILLQGPGGYFDDLVLKSLVTTHPLVIFDNIPGKSHLDVFEGVHFKGKHIPLYIGASWEMGGGAEEEVLNFVLTHYQNYRPMIVAFSGWVASNIAWDLAKELFRIFLKKLPGKRQPLTYMSKSGKIIVFEFPSNTTEKDFDLGLKDIPGLASGEGSAGYYIRDLANKKWMAEETS